MILFDGMVVVLFCGIISFTKWNEIEKIKQKLGVKVSTSYSIMLLETSALPIQVVEVLVQSVYNYITKVKNMPNHRFPKQV